MTMDEAKFFDIRRRLPENVISILFASAPSRSAAGVVVLINHAHVEPLIDR